MVVIEAQNKNSWMPLVKKYVYFYVWSIKLSLIIHNIKNFKDISILLKSNKIGSP